MIEKSLSFFSEFQSMLSWTYSNIYIFIFIISFDLLNFNTTYIIIEKCFLSDEWLNMLNISSVFIFYFSLNQLNLFMHHKLSLRSQKPWLNARLAINQVYVWHSLWHGFIKRQDSAAGGIGGIGGAVVTQSRTSPQCQTMRLCLSSTQRRKCVSLCMLFAHIL